MKTFYSFVSLIVLLLCFSCKGKQGSNTFLIGDTLKLEYAKNIEIIRYKNFTLVNLKNPWKPQKHLAQYIVSKSKKHLNQRAFPHAIKVLVPLKRMVISTTTHCWLVNQLNQTQHIAGVCDLPYIHVLKIVQLVQSKHIVDCGNSFYPNLEQIALLQPDALWVSPLEDSREQTKLLPLHIPLIMCADYMESHPLARAEWMRFYGILLGCEEQSNKLFNAVKMRYNALVLKAKKSANKRSVLLEKPYENVWYCPAGHSTIGKMLSDASAYYALSQTPQSGSLPLTIEQVLAQFSTAQAWAFTYNAPINMRFSQISKLFKGVSLLKAYKNKQVYGCNAQLKPFYEETPFRPDLLLNDFIIMLHANKGCVEKMRYYDKLD